MTKFLSKNLSFLCKMCFLWSGMIVIWNKLLIFAAFHFWVISEWNVVAKFGSQLVSAKKYLGPMQYYAYPCIYRVEGPGKRIAAV